VILTEHSIQSTIQHIHIHKQPGQSSFYQEKSFLFAGERVHFSRGEFTSLGERVPFRRGKRKFISPGEKFPLPGELTSAAERINFSRRKVYLIPAGEQEKEFVSPRERVHCTN
jgi:hypothetical protein